ncbi:M23 family metallopeptidase [Herpetosiphon gulosus]|uniref:M23ase beta-sheet core domain-containing protein n=1 Tax=Herpetosiphon gulosus TaxID=1973496 RepID=A0ABP9WYU2_9CHLR
MQFKRLSLLIFLWFGLSLMSIGEPNTSQAAPPQQFLRNPSWSVYNRSQGYHNGYAVDFPTGTSPVVAAGDGVVNRVGTNPRRNCGSGVPFNGTFEREFRIDHQNSYGTGYLHLGSFGINPRTGQEWKAGDQIFAGEVIGKSGNSGCATGNHLHFWVYQENNGINPDTTNLWMPTYPDTGRIENPASNSTVAGLVSIRGWAKVTRTFQTNSYKPASGGAIERVEIWMYLPNYQNFIKLGNAKYGEYRNDLGGNFGWSFTWDTSRITASRYQIQARAVSTTGGISVLEGYESGSVWVNTSGPQHQTKWHMRYNLSNGNADFSFNYGQANDIPIVGDWDGDGKDTPGVVRGNMWYLSNSYGEPYTISFNFGEAGDIPVVGDWDGDGKDTPGLVRGTIWYISNSLNGGWADRSFGFGEAGDIPVVGDWNGDGKDTPGVVRGITWYLSNNLNGGWADISLGFGELGDKFIVGDWDGDGDDTPGVVRGNMWYLSNNLNGGWADLSFMYGDPANYPIVGNWDGDRNSDIGVIP